MTEAAAPKTDSDWKPAGNPWLIAVAVTMAAFMEVLDTTIVNVALPHIAGSLSASYDQATWALTSYLVANSIVLPISAFFGRLFGRDRADRLVVLFHHVALGRTGFAPVQTTRTDATGAFEFRRAKDKDGKPAGYDAQQTPIVSVTKDGKFVIEK